MAIKLLALSSSRSGDGTYLETAVPLIEKFLGNKPLQIAFVPFALVNTDYETYTQNVRNALAALPHHLQTVTPENGKAIIGTSDVVMVGGGNTFKLLHDLYALDLIDIIKTKVQHGTPYIGWSAGSNIAGATICTSNDMPIINPGSFDALGFLPFQINPHYYNMPIAGFHGETRNQRLAEFVQLNPQKKIVALPEGTALILEDNRLSLVGNNNAFMFSWQQNNTVQEELMVQDDLSFLMQ